MPQNWLLWLQSDTAQTCQLCIDYKTVSKHHYSLHAVCVSGNPATHADTYCEGDSHVVEKPSRLHLIISNFGRTLYFPGGIFSMHCTETASFLFSIGILSHCGEFALDFPYYLLLVELWVHTVRWHKQHLETFVCWRNSSVTTVKELVLLCFGWEWTDLMWHGSGRNFYFCGDIWG